METTSSGHKKKGTRQLGSAKFIKEGKKDAGIAIPQKLLPACAHLQANDPHEKRSVAEIKDQKGREQEKKKKKKQKQK